MKPCDHAPPPDAFAWSLWARCACGAVEHRQGDSIDARAVVMSEAHYDGQRTQDGIDISSRRKRREYMRANNLADFSDYQQTWRRAEKARAEAWSNPQEKAHRREALARAMERGRR